MMADLVNEDIGNDGGKGFAMFGPKIEDRAAIKKDRIRHLAGFGGLGMPEILVCAAVAVLLYVADGIYGAVAASWSARSKEIAKLQADQQSLHQLCELLGGVSSAV